MPAPLSLEEKHDQRTAAHHFLQKVKEREQQLLREGASYEKGPNRSFILKRAVNSKQQTLQTS